MEIKSIKGLTDIAERAESLSNHIRSLSTREGGPGFPDVPLPLSLEATEAWLLVVTECCRKPLLAKSKQLLEARGIATATISAAVLEKPDLLTSLLQRLDRLHEDLRQGAFESLARALTKGIEDGETVVTMFETASNKVNALADSAEWLLTLVAAKLVEAPNKADEVIKSVRQISELLAATARRGVETRPFSTLEDALANLTQLETLKQEHDGFYASEGLSGERPSLAGLSVQEALNKLLQATTSARSEKARLLQEAQTVQGQLALIGGESHESASTIAELRRLVPRLQELLEARRRVFRTTLGSTAFRVVESLAEGKCPAAEEVTDEELGTAIRKAIKCGYRFFLEAPREN